MNTLIIDDDHLVSSALQTILEAQGIAVSGTGSSGEEAVSLYKEKKPDIILMDIRMGEMTGLDAAALILEHDPQAKIIFLTTFSDDEYIIRALKMGAKGYLLKQDFESIVPALTAVALGQSIFGHEVVAKLPGMMKERDNTDLDPVLSHREKSILVLIAEGYSNREIAGKLFLSEGTVRNNISTMLDKLDVRDRTQLAIYFYKRG